MHTHSGKMGRLNKHRVQVRLL